jgi:glycosyltransferase involved in cell wall biosynthesis
MIYTPLVTIVTPTIGTRHLEENLHSVSKQTYKNLKHLVVTDGKEYTEKTESLVSKFPKAKHLVLPENTGRGGYNGHRIYAAASYLVETDFFCFIDEDNWIDTDHVIGLLEAANNKHWSFSFRKIVDQESKYVCNDDCESLGLWESCLGDFFVDVGCYFLPKNLAVQLSPLWYRRARHPQEQPEIDRLLINVLRQNNLTYNASRKYSLNYRTGNRGDSVQSEFFLQGNAAMLTKHNGKLPWKE